MIYILFLIYKLEVYEWFCEAEGNSAACYLAAKESHQRGNFLRANQFYEKSCDLDYAYGCFQWAHSRQDADEDWFYEIMHKACELGHDEACKE